jgi:hypothetical protein
VTGAGKEPTGHRALLDGLACFLPGSAFQGRGKVKEIMGGRDGRAVVGLGAWKLGGLVQR